jgi:hypothetical protein
LRSKRKVEQFDVLGLIPIVSRLSEQFRQRERPSCIP